MEQNLQRVISSPIGPLRLVTSAAALRGLYFTDHKRAPAECKACNGAHAVLDQAAGELAEYFAGTRTTFATPLDHAGTAFQRQVWTALGTIPFGERWSYAQLATTLGRPQAFRAVASANALNPLSIFTPCHRVVGSDGQLRGYAGGLPAKRWLLDLESA